VILYMDRGETKIKTDEHLERWQPPVAERPRPHVCRHGFISDCLAPDCENAEREKL